MSKLMCNFEIEVFLQVGYKLSPHMGDLNMFLRALVSVGLYTACVGCAGK